RTLVDARLVRGAVEATARLARTRGLLDWLERRIERADLPVRASEALFFFLVALVLALTVTTVLLGPAIGFIAAIIGLLGPVVSLNRLVERRQRAFAAQLPDTLDLLASALRAGNALPTAVDNVAREATGPVGRELRRVSNEVRLGQPIVASLERAARRVANPDFEWVVLALRIQAEAGGNLPELLTTVRGTMVSRERVRREIRSLTAEGRASALVLGALPLVLAAGLAVVNRPYIARLLDDGLGRAMVVVAAALAAAGFVWMQRIIDIRI
ncbi:MAG: type II secretion system F family protein, partial [Acidimicrobiales bacterium]